MPSLSPYAGISILDNFVPNVQGFQDGIRGQIPGPPIEALPTWTIRADGTWGPSAAGITFVPVIRFTGNATGGTSQTFSDTNLASYNLAEDIQLFVTDSNPSTIPRKLFGGTTSAADFTLSGSTINVAFNLPANAILFIDSKALPRAMETYRILTEGRDYINTQGNDRINTQLLSVYTDLMGRLQNISKGKDG